MYTLIKDHIAYSAATSSVRSFQDQRIFTYYPWFNDDYKNHDNMDIYD